MGTPGWIPLVNTLDAVTLGHTSGAVRTPTYTFSSVHYEKPVTKVVRKLRNHGPWRERPFSGTSAGPRPRDDVGSSCGTVYPAGGGPMYGCRGWPEGYQPGVPTSHPPTTVTGCQSVLDLRNPMRSSLAFHQFGRKVTKVPRIQRCTTGAARTERRVPMSKTRAFTSRTARTSGNVQKYHGRQWSTEVYGRWFSAGQVAITRGFTAVWL